jgi:hypothetical protein
MEKLTRKELFDLVWTTPMSKLAARFGVSDVALAKTCAKYDIPRPGRGYWQQLAAGIKGKRPRLPSSKDSEPIVLARMPLANIEAVGEEPIVVVSERLTDPHPAVRWLEEAFASAKPDPYGRLDLRNSYGPAFSVRPPHVRRLLRIMDALAKALTVRGHEVVAAKRSEKLSCPDILVRLAGEQFALQVEERLDRKPHALTAEEKQRKAQWGYVNPPSYDYFTDGALKLKLMFTHYKYVGQKSWSDTKTRRLDDLLGRVELAIEKAAHISSVEHAEQARVAAQRRVEEMKRLRVERLQRYRGWLTEDLDRMLADRERAGRIRAFMEEYERRLPADARTEVAVRWSEAVHSLADRLDPMNRAAEIAKELEPSDEVLARMVEEAKETAQRTKVESAQPRA